MVELRTRKREMRGSEGNHHEKQGLKSISCASQLTIPNTTDSPPDLVGRYSNFRSSKPNQASHTADFSYVLISSISCPSSSSFSLSRPEVYHHHRSQSSVIFSISPCCDYVLTLSTAYTNYSMHQVQYTPSAPSTPDCQSSLDSPDYKLTPECCFRFRCASLQVQPALHEGLKVKIPYPHFHSCELTT
jgi:hypothetical protein